MEDNEVETHLVIYKDWFEDPPNVNGYNKSSLMKIVEEYGLNLIGEYETVKRGTRIEGHCIEENCEGTWGKQFVNLIKEGGGPCCKNCVTKRRIERFKQTNLITRGVENVSQDPIIKQAKKETNIRVRGVEFSLQCPEIRKQIGITNEEKYGDKCILAKTSSIRKQIEATNKEKYNNKCPLWDPAIRKRVLATWKENYGEDHPMKSEYVQKKVEDTIEEKFGVRNVFQNKDVQEKIKQTNIIRYGVENPTQNREILEKALKSGYSQKEYRLPSGQIRWYQGYENFTWDFLLFQLKYCEQDILTGKDVPPIPWIDLSGKSHVYHCDHFIPFKNLLIETKSSWTFEKEEENNLLKQKFAKEAGYKHQFFIWNAKGEIEDIID